MIRLLIGVMIPLLLLGESVAAQVLTAFAFTALVWWMWGATSVPPSPPGARRKSGNYDTSD